MNKTQEILVPLDFSERLPNSPKYAVSLAEETSAELVVLHVFEKGWRDHSRSVTSDDSETRGSLIWERLQRSQPP